MFFRTDGVMRHSRPNWITCHLYRVIAVTFFNQLPLLALRMQTQEATALFFELPYATTKSLVGGRQRGKAAEH